MLGKWPQKRQKDNNNNNNNSNSNKKRNKNGQNSEKSEKWIRIREEMETKKRQNHLRNEGQGRKCSNEHLIMGH